ncbi:hypothetical protein [Methylobacterium cerastii]|uniref:hypothetical protein n=1 Tax=Methylobacterium cerastii TaxID=932741 RepID=UPI001EE1D2C8|nr:hypothetical protein [Methylobacterium cerastii]
MTDAVPALTIAYQQQMFDAWNALTGDMPAAAAMELLAAAVHHALAAQAPFQRGIDVVADLSRAA